MSLHAAKSVRVFGYVVDSDNRGVELANVYVEENTTIGTTTNQNGYYELFVELPDTVTLVYSMIGYETIRQQLYTTRDVIGINVELPTNEELLNEITVRAIQRQTNTMDRVDIGAARLMPDATGGGIENLLITFAGVRQNNEMSSQYNVRGGSFDENSVYVNGIEVHRPLLIRSGQQEGLSFVNTDMVENVDFSAGGFDAKYGDKMSSVLDIRYKRPTRLESRLNMSLLGASAYVGWGNGTQSQMHSIRYKTSRYLLGALETAGNYKPLLSPQKDPRRLRSCNKEAVCAVHLAINHPLPYDKSSIALDCYANLELVSAFAGQKLLIGLENNQATYEAEWRKCKCVVGHRLQELGTGDQ